MASAGLVDLAGDKARSELVERVVKYRQHLKTAVNLAKVYGDPEADRRESDIYSINTRIYRVTPRNAKGAKRT